MGPNAINVKDFPISNLSAGGLGLGKHNVTSNIWLWRWFDPV